MRSKRDHKSFTNCGAFTQPPPSTTSACDYCDGGRRIAFLSDGNPICQLVDLSVCQFECSNYENRLWSVECCFVSGLIRFLQAAEVGTIGPSGPRKCYPDSSFSSSFQLAGRRMIGRRLKSEPLARSAGGAPWPVTSPTVKVIGLLNEL